MAGMDLVVNLGLNATQFTRGLASATASMNKISSRGLRRGSVGPTDILSAGLGRTIVMANLASKAIARIGAEMWKTAKAAVSLHAQTEQTLLSFEVLAGGKEIGTALFRELEQIAQNTALTFDEVSASAKQLLISFDPTQVPGLIRMLGNISASMDLVSLREMAWLLQTSREEGKLLARDLRQFTTRGIPVPKALKEVLGLEGPGAGEKLSEMITAGEVKIQHLFQALQKLGSGNILDRMGDTLIGKWMQMVDAQRLMMRDLGTLISEIFNFGKILDWVKGRSIAIRQSFRDYKPVYESVFQAVRQGFIMVLEVFNDIRKGLTQLFAKWIPDQNTVNQQIVTFSTIARFAMKEWRLGAKIALVFIHLGILRLGQRLKHFATKEAPLYWEFLSENAARELKWAAATAEIVFGKIIKNIGIGFNEMLKEVTKGLVKNLNLVTMMMKKIPGMGGIAESVDNSIADFMGEAIFGPADPKDTLEDWRKMAFRDAATPLGELPKAPGDTKRMKEYQKLLNTLTGQFGKGMDAAVADALQKLKDFAPAAAAELGKEAPFDFGGAPGGRGSKGKREELGVMQQGSKEAIKAVLTAMGGRDKSPEVIELKRQTMMLKYFGDQLKREQRYKELHNPRAATTDISGFMGIQGAV